MDEPPNVRLDLANSAENVVLVRAALAGLAEAIGLAGSDLIDVQTAATEACNNVVQHAYGGEAGPLEIELRLAPGKLDLLVRDQGRGIPSAPEAANGHEEPGIGLPVIQALAHRAEFRERDGGGTEIWSEFAPAGIRCPPALGEREEQSSATVPPPAGEVALVLTPTELAHAILPRVLCVLAARAHFSTERLADIQRFAGELVADSEQGSGQAPFRLTASVEPRALALRVGTREVRFDDRRDDEGRVTY